MSGVKFVKSIGFVCLVTLLLVSCTKSKNEKIQGTWQRYNTTLSNFEVDTMQQEMWIIDNGKIDIYTRTGSLGNITYKIKAHLKYTTKLSKGRFALMIEVEEPVTAEMQSKIYKGEARIYRLKDDNFAMKGVDTFEYYEFYR